MDTSDLNLPVHPDGELDFGEAASVAVETFGGRVHVEWDPEAAVTPLGQLSFFIDFLKTAELFEPWVEDCPIRYTSPNAPAKRDVLGTVLLSILAGHKRYAHITSIRGDGVNPELLGMRKTPSEDSVRRAFLNADEAECAAWQRKHLMRCYEPLLYEPWILDVDTTVKPLYGRQEGAVRGYNPRKPGRPSHAYHTYSMANLRLILDVEVQPGNQTASSHTRPELKKFLAALPPQARPAFVRGDIGFGNEGMMSDAEALGVPYLFKIKKTPNVKRLIESLFERGEWEDAGQGWQGARAELRLSGWSRARQVVVLRRQVRDAVALEDKADDGQLSFSFLETLESTATYEYAVLATSLPDEIRAVAQHYRDRSDSENPFDELKNQWGWGGFTTQDLKRSQIMARVTALVYNWWSLFVRLAVPDRHAEAITSRPLLLHGVARQTRHAGQKRVTITSAHAKRDRIRKILNYIARFLQSVRATAEQLDRAQRWRIILSRACVKFLKGRPLATPKFLQGAT